jgi:hypothetical protein
MEWIEWRRLMAPLLFCLYPSAMSKLLSASSKPTSTTLWLSFNPLENRYRRKKGKNICLSVCFNTNYRELTRIFIKDEKWICNDEGLR